LKPPPIRVALLATTIEYGGIESVLLTLLQNMNSQVEIVPILFTRLEVKNSFMERLQTLGVAYHTVFVNTSRVKYFNPVRNVWDTIRILRKHRVDLIHTHGYRADLIGLAAARWFRLPIVSTCHGFISTDRHLSFYSRLDALVLRFFTRIITVSARMKDDLVAVGVDQRRIDVITNAVAAVSLSDSQRTRFETRSRLGIVGDEFVFGFVGRLSEEKGPDLLLKAAAHLDTGSNWRLLFLGDGPLRPRLERMTTDLGLSERVEFLGFQADTTPWYSAMDAFVLPSLTEGTPMALLEAMAHGLPAIASAVGGVPAVIANKRNGLLVPPGDQHRLVDAMRLVATRPALRSILSAAGLQLISETYDVKSWVKRVREFYRTAMTGPHGTT